MSEKTTNENVGKKKPSLVQQYRNTMIGLLILVLIWLINDKAGESIVRETVINLRSMLEVLPPILILIGLLDVWVDRQTMIKYMGENAGIKGFFFAFILGSLAAGPLYMAFPIAAILMKKQARYAYILFFLGVWSSTKLPIAIYEINSFGLSFTMLHMGVNLFIFAIGAIVMEKAVHPNRLQKIYSQAISMINN